MAKETKSLLTFGHLNYKKDQLQVHARWVVQFAKVPKSFMYSMTYGTYIEP